MWHRRRGGSDQERASAGDPLSTAVWQEGHLTGAAASSPIIKAPRAADLVGTDTA
jgi:hypothetical protein